MKRISVITGILGLVLGLGTGCTSKQKDVPETENNTLLPEEGTPTVGVECLRSGSFNQEVISNGKLTAKQKAEVRFETSAPIERIWVKNGDRVSKGQAIAEIDRTDLQMSVQKIADNRERTKLELQDILIGQGYKLDQLDRVPDAVMKLAETKSGYKQISLDYKSALTALSKATLRAPFSGIVANLSAKPHNMPPSGEPFCTIVDDSRLEANFTIMENELATVRKGDPVSVSFYAMKDREVTGNITEINPIVGENGLVKIKAEITNQGGHFYEGMSVRVKIRKVMRDLLVVPKSAVVLRDGKQVVFTLKKGRAYWNYVTTGQENSTDYTIEKGLAVGDSVITEGNLHLAHLTRVNLNKKNMNH